MIYTRYWLKVGVAAGTALVAGGLLVGLTRPPVFHSVPVLTAAVKAMHPIPHNAVHWIQVKTAPPGALNRRVNWSALVASQSLAPGTILTNADFTAGQINGLHPGEVQWLAPVSAAGSGLATVGQRVDVWSDVKGSFQLVAYGVRVIGLYSSNGSAVAASNSGSGSSSTGMVALAVPQTSINTFLNVSTPYLVIDPNQTQFRLASAAAGSSSSTPTTSASSAKAKTRQTKKTAHSALPTTHGG
ncbi:MAG: hypothetical protein C7B43_20365 [Sulfobacillus benefaciens]|uniref:SAF domain-containing protein n=1 Tax=Sulfobacillus benefaciens TaxID=453960 RepID=A0A2T2WLI3_9FIRM|nr:MAG: hypothetical protein C7B43_20365 [Sulfobacillus benefaciens]